MSNQQFERLLTNLQGIMRCPHCSGKYETTDIHYLGQMDAMTFLHMRCAECQTPVFASVALTDEQGELKACDIATNQIQPEEPEAQAELGFVTKKIEAEAEYTQVPIEDLTTEKLMAAATLPVTYDQVLDAHQYLSDFSGDFEAVFGPH